MLCIAWIVLLKAARHFVKTATNVSPRIVEFVSGNSCCYLSHSFYTKVYMVTTVVCEVRLRQTVE